MERYKPMFFFGPNQFRTLFCRLEQWNGTVEQNPWKIILAPTRFAHRSLKMLFNTKGFGICYIYP